MIGKPLKDRTSWDKADEFCWYMETMHPGEEVRRQFRLVRIDGTEFIEIWSIQWGGETLLGRYEVVKRFRHGMSDYIMMNEPEQEPPFGVYSYTFRMFSRTVVRIYNIKPELKAKLIELYAPEQSAQSGSSGEDAGVIQEDEDLLNTEEDIGSAASEQQVFTPEECRDRLADATEKFFAQFYDNGSHAGDGSFTFLYTDDRSVYDYWNLQFVLNNDTRSHKEIAPLFPEDDSDSHKLYMAVLDREDTDELQKLLDGGYEKCPHDFKIFGSYASEIAGGLSMAELLRQENIHDEKQKNFAKRAVQLCGKLIELGYFSTKEEVCEFFKTEYMPRMKAVYGAAQTALAKLSEIDKECGGVSENEKEIRIYTEIVVPAVRTETPGMSWTQHLVKATLEKVEFCRSQLRVYLTFRNNSDFTFFFFADEVTLLQDGRQMQPDIIDYSMLPADTVHSHTSSSGMLMFDVKESQKDFRLIIDGSYIGTEDEPGCETECFFEFDVEVESREPLSKDDFDLTV